MKRTALILLNLLILSIVACRPSTEDEAPVATSVDQIKGYKINVVSGSLYDIVMSDDYDLVRVSSIPDQIPNLLSGASDFLISDSVSFIGVDATALGVEFCFSSDIVSGDAGIAFNYDSPDLQQAFNEFLATIKSDGTYQQMNERWLACDDINEARMPDFPEQNGEPIEAGICVNFPFIFMQGGEWVGWEVEMLNRYAQYLGRPINYHNYDFSGIIPALVSKRVDLACSFMFVTEERSKQVLFSDTYFHSRAAIFRKLADSAGTKQEMSFFEKTKNSFRNNLIEDSRWKLLAEGLWETIVISFFSILAGSVVGAGICWMRMSRKKILKGTARVYVEIMRGVPILVFLMIMFYLIFASTGVSARWVAVFAFALNFGAYSSEIFRTAIEGVSKGQREAGLAMGFSNSGTFFNFILPQAVKTAIPVYKGEAVSTIKATSIVGYIAIQDLTKMSDLIRARTFDPFFPLIFISIIYFILAWLMGKALDLLVKKGK